MLNKLAKKYLRSNRLLTIDRYKQVENAAFLRSSNRIIECVQPSVFQLTGYPSRVAAQGELARFAEVMHENKFEYIFRVYLGGVLTADEVGMFEKLATHVFTMTKQLYGKAQIPAANLLIALSIYRNLRLLLSPSDSIIFEVGGGCGYLGAMLALNGFRIISMDVTQAFYLYQSHLYRTLLGDNFIELATEKPNTLTDGSIVDELRFGSNLKIVHLPWWEYYKAEPNFPAIIDAVTCNHCLGEMHPWAFDYMVTISIDALEQSQHPHAGFLFQAYGSPVKRTASSVYHGFYSRKYYIAHNDEMFSVFAKAKKGDNTLCPDPMGFGNSLTSKEWFDLGQSHASNHHYESSLQSFIFAGELNSQTPLLVESVREVLSATNLQISEQLLPKLASLFPDDDFISARLPEISVYHGKPRISFLDAQPPSHANTSNSYSSSLTTGREALNRSAEYQLEDIWAILQKITGTTDIRTDDEKFFDIIGVTLV